MTPADRDAAVALAQIVRNCVIDDDGDVKIDDRGIYRTASGIIHELARAVLAERPTCGTCAYWSPARSRGVDVGYCDHADSPAHNCEVPKTWFCADHEPTPSVTCSVCRRDDCGGDHPCE